MILGDSIVEKIKEYYRLKGRFILVRKGGEQRRLFSTIQYFEIHLSSPPHKKIKLCVKKYRKGCFSNLEQRVESEYKGSRKYRKFFLNDDEFYIINYITYIPDELTLVSEYCDGMDLINLQKFYVIMKDKIKRIYFNCGRFLKKLHDIDKQVDHYIFPQLLKYNGLRLAKLSENDGRYFNEMMHREILLLMETLCKQYDKKELLHVGLHGDFAPSNIRVSEDNLYLLDFCNFKKGLIYEDIAYFLTYTLIDCLMYVTNMKKYNILRKAFLNGYSAQLDQGLLDLFMLKHLVNYAWGTFMRMEDKRFKIVKKYFDRRIYFKSIKQISLICSKYR